MASQSSVIGLLRVLLSANTAEFDTRLKNSQTVAKDFGTSIQGVAKSLKELSGENLLKGANNTVAAIEKLGGVQKLTAAEQAKVNAELTKAIEKYTALGIQAPKALTDVANATKHVEQPTSLLSKTLGDFGTTFKATLAGFISAQAIIGGVTMAWKALSELVVSSVAAFSEQEAAIKKMTTALTAQGNATPTVIKQYKDMASQFQQTTVFSDELINEMQALLVQVGDVMPAEMEGALQAATNLASGLGIDLRQATMLVGKAFEGETGTLKRYGIVIDETKLKTQGITAVLDAIQSKFGGQAQAEAETYAGKLKQIANSWGEVQEAIGEIIISNPIVEATLRDLKTALDGGTGAVIEHQHSWSNLLRTLSGDTLGPLSALTVLVRKLEDAAIAANKAAAAAKFSPEFIKPAASHQAQAEIDAARDRERKRKQAEADKAAAAAADALRKSIKALQEQLSGRKLQADVVLLAEAFRRFTDEELKNTFATDRVADAAQKLFDQHAVLTPQLFRLIIANGNLAASLPPVVKGLEGVTIADRLVNDHFAKTLALVKDLIPELKVIQGLPDRVGIKLPLPEAPDFVSWRVGLNEVASAVRDLGRIAPGHLGMVISGIGDMINGFDQAAAAVERLQDTTLTGMQRMAAGISVATNVLGWFLTAVNIAEQVGDRLRGSERRDAFEARGGADALRTQALLAGVNPAGLFNPANASAFRAELKRVDAAIAANIERMQRYGLSWTDLSAEMRQLQVNQTVRELADDFRRLTEFQGVAPDRAIKGMSAALNQLVIDAKRTGTKIPASMRPILEQLIRMGELTDEAARALLGLESEAVPAWADIEAAANRYGIALDSLGPKVEQIRINEVASQIVDDFNLLIRSGADMNAVLNGMTDEVQELVTRALTLGLTLPESMRPLIQALIDAGLLTDQFGNKLDDLEGISFAKPLTESIDELIEKLNELIDALNDVDDAANRALRPRPPGSPTTGHAVPRPPDDEGFASGTPGLGFVDFGGGTPAWLHSREAVVPESGVGDFAGQVASALSTESVGGFGLLRSETILEVDKRVLGRVVADVLPNELRRLGVRVRA